MNNDEGYQELQDLLEDLESTDKYQTPDILEVILKYVKRLRDFIKK